MTPAGGVGGEPRGRVGSTVYTRGPHGPYSYTWVPHVDLDSPLQQYVRSNFAQAARRWSLIPAAFRVPWDSYAANVKHVNRVAVPYHLSGFQAYVAHLGFLGQTHNIAFNPDAAPTVFTLAILRPPSYREALRPGRVRVDFNLDDPWRWSSYGSGFVLYASRPQTTSVAYFRGPYQYTNDRAGHPSNPPYAMIGILPFAPTPQKPRIFFRGRVVHEDRLSPSVFDHLDYDL